MAESQFTDEINYKSGLMEAKLQSFDELKTYFISKIPTPSRSILRTFDDLKDDQFLPDSSWNFRKRSYAKGFLSIDGIKWMDQTDFCQSSTINQYVGDVNRVFDPACTEIKNFIESLMLSKLFVELINNHSYNFGLHQIRTITNDENEGYPVPEGFHQDGFDFVIIISFYNYNVKGGRCYLREGSKEGPCVLDQEMNANDVLIFNDRRFFHYASPINPKYQD